VPGAGPGQPGRHAGSAQRRSLGRARAACVPGPAVVAVTAAPSLSISLCQLDFDQSPHAEPSQRLMTRMTMMIRDTRTWTVVTCHCQLARLWCHSDRDNECTEKVTTNIVSLAVLALVVRVTVTVGPGRHRRRPSPSP
jgi:hypothetical protein